MLIFRDELDAEVGDRALTALRLIYSEGVLTACCAECPCKRA